MFIPAPCNNFSLFLLINVCAALKEDHHARGRIGNVLAKSSTFLVTFFMTSATGHVHDVAAILINSRIRNIVRKKIIRFAKIVCQVSLMVVPTPCVSRGSLPRSLPSMTLMVVISLTANVEAQLVMLIVTPLISLGIVVCILSSTFVDVA